MQLSVRLLVKFVRFLLLRLNVCMYLLKIDTKKVYLFKSILILFVNQINLFIQII